MENHIYKIELSEFGLLNENDISECLNLEQFLNPHGFYDDEGFLHENGDWPEVEDAPPGGQIDDETLQGDEPCDDEDECSFCRPKADDMDDEEEEEEEQAMWPEEEEEEMSEDLRD